MISLGVDIKFFNENHSVLQTILNDFTKMP